MVDLEDHHEEDISVEGVAARLLGHDDAGALGKSLVAEAQRAAILLRDVYVGRLGTPPTMANGAAIGIIQGVTFAVAYFQESGRLTPLETVAALNQIQELAESLQADGTALVDVVIGLREIEALADGAETPTAWPSLHAHAQIGLEQLRDKCQALRAAAAALEAAGDKASAASARAAADE